MTLEHLFDTVAPPLGPTDRRRPCCRHPSTFHALVNPGGPIPPYISHLTGIDDFLVREEPPIEAVLPAFLEFARGAIFVAHNARFDFSFLN